MQETVGAFAILGVAGGLPAPLDSVIGLGVLTALVIRDRATWDRHVAAFAWLASRVWPVWINDPFHVYSLVLFLTGFTLFHARLIQRIPKFHELIEVIYLVMVLLPFHDAPDVAMSMVFAGCVVVEWAVATQHTPETLVRPCVWILCVRTPILALVPIVYGLWRMRQHVSRPAVSSVVTKPNPVSVTRQKRNRPIPSVNPPAEYLARDYDVETTYAEIVPDPEIGSIPPIDSDTV